MNGLVQTGLSSARQKQRQGLQENVKPDCTKGRIKGTAKTSRITSRNRQEEENCVGLSTQTKNRRFGGFWFNGAPR
jgi:hypothetical protein